MVLALVAMTLVGTFEIRMADMQERRVAGEAADFRAVERCLVRYHALNGSWPGTDQNRTPSSLLNVVKDCLGEAAEDALETDINAAVLRVEDHPHNSVLGSSMKVYRLCLPQPDAGAAKRLERRLPWSQYELGGTFHRVCRKLMPTMPTDLLSGGKLELTETVTASYVQLQRSSVRLHGTLCEDEHALRADVDGGLLQCREDDTEWKWK